MTSSLHHVGQGKVLFFYERAGKLRVAEIDALARRVEADGSISLGPPAAPP